MNPNLKENERELIKLVNFFKKRAEKLMLENKLDTDYNQLITTCDKLVEQLHIHARNREIILAEREQLKNLVKDNAQCPKCGKNTHLKLSGTDKSEEGWKSNKYKCRKCNIEFVWARPNNPWDMIPYVENFVAGLEQKVLDENVDVDSKLLAMETVVQMKANLAKLKPVVEASDLDYSELEAREKEMAKMVHEFKNHLLIEKIRMDTWEEKE
jgi:hypothetical protein